MALKLKSKSKKAVKKVTKKKTTKDKSVKICKYYSDIEEVKFLDLDVTLDKLRYGHIIYCDVSRVTLVDGNIDINNSWIELLLIMIDTVRVNYPDTFLEVLMKNEVTHQNFCIDNKYGKYSFDKDNFKAYKIFDSGYYLEAIFNVENIFWAIIRLAKCLGIELDKMSLKLYNKNYTKEDIKLKELEEETTVVIVSQSKEFFKKGIHLVNMNINGTHISVHRIEAVLAAFCNYIHDTYGVEGLKKLSKNGKTRISYTNTLDSESNMEIKHSGVYVYSDCEVESIIEFIVSSMNNIDMDKSDVKFYFRKLKLKEDKKEWEIE